ncbi:MAG: RNA polymerase subunit sigma, partial [Planctomycetaceae bacterium]|nr:RNA polymerase subunit sigma [Planctomycetaceae bacterium]
QEESIHAALKSLPEVLRQIVRLRFGLGDRGKSLSFRAIAERLGMSRERTRRLCNKALLKLRSHPGLKQLEPSVS